MSDLTILLKPSLLSLKNRWKTTLRRKDRNARDFTMLGLAIFFMLAEYQGLLGLLKLLNNNPDFIIGTPKIIINLIFLFLAALLILSNFVQSISSLYTGRDLDFILSSPISNTRLFFGKFLEVLFSTSWVAVLFVLPFLFVLQSFYNLPYIFFLKAIPVLLPLFVLPCAFSFTLASIYPLLLPRKYSREILVLAGLGVLFVIFKLLSLITHKMDLIAETGMSELLNLASLLNLPNRNWLPTYWIGTTLAEFIEPLGKPIFIFFLLSILSIISLISFAYFLLSQFHFYSFSKLTGGSVSQKKTKANLLPLVSVLSKLFGNEKSAIIAKDYLLFSRDITQAAQSGIFFGLSSMYLFILQSQKLFEAGTDSPAQNWWLSLISISNASLECFILIAVGTRLVYPSLSLEGSSFWAIQSSPMNIKQILSAKLNAWFLPISIIFGTIFTIAAYSLNASLTVAMIKLICTLFTCYGICGLAIGFGAYFSNFNWDHSSELAAGLGSLLFILTSFVIAVIDIGIITAILSKWNNNMLVPIGSDATIDFKIVIGLIVLFFFNIFIAKFAITQGERKLLAELGS